jgi:thioredoxin-like negative regulator of GroEL
MAARGLWEQALKHYQQAAEEEPLAPEAELELARIHIEMRQLDRAEEILKKWKADPRYEQPAALLMSRVNVLKGPPAKPQPPRVTR